MAWRSRVSWRSRVYGRNRRAGPGATASAALAGAYHGSITFEQRITRQFGRIAPPVSTAPANGPAAGVGSWRWKVFRATRSGETATFHRPASVRARQGRWAWGHPESGAR